MATLARAGDPEANYRMGLYHLDKQNQITAVQYFRPAAEIGHLDARLQIILALMHNLNSGMSFSTLCVILRAEMMLCFDATRASWIQDEINAGSLTVAFLYCTAKILHKQQHEAIVLLTTQANEHGSMLAMGALGERYETGDGVPQNLVTAYIWYNLAAAIGLRAAAQDRDSLAGLLPQEQLIAAQQQATDAFFSLNSRLLAESRSAADPA
jgi:TPR repeat protein